MQVAVFVCSEGIYPWSKEFIAFLEIFLTFFKIYT